MVAAAVAPNRTQQPPSPRRLPLSSSQMPLRWASTTTAAGGCKLCTAPVGGVAVNGVLGLHSWWAGDCRGACLGCASLCRLGGWHVQRRCLAHALCSGNPTRTVLEKMLAQMEVRCAFATSHMCRMYANLACLWVVGTR